ncbi:MAG: ferrous iron transport protein B [Neisseria sp.]|nr:ferrous iron transport protein B [Neisseria sp.]
MSDKKDKLLIALAGQQNAGKSTLFNALTGLQQHIANYPGVTVDKKSGFYTYEGQRVETVDLPGTYALTSFSPEERVARDFLLGEKPDVMVNVVDAANLERSLFLTFQLMELNRPMLLVLNMMDMAQHLGLAVDAEKLSAHLGIPVMATVGSKARGIDELRAKIAEVAAQAQAAPNFAYGAWEEAVQTLAEAWKAQPNLPDVPPRWAALQVLEHDEGIAKLAQRTAPEAWQRIAQTAQDLHAQFTRSSGQEIGDEATRCRHIAAQAACKAAVTQVGEHKVGWTEHLDKVLLNRFFAPVFLVLTIWLIYQLSIVQGYELTKITWPILAGLRNLVAGLLPDAGFLIDPQVRSIGLWMVDSANTLLNYVPIFLILFALIAILEDSGYMARIAFILDRILHRFGLHGQSTLPLILAGVFAGGCAVPGVMATKGIPDTRARMATILTVPFMNCLAKVPLYTLLVNIYFANDKGLVLFYISTITVIVALLVSKLLTVSVLRGMETAPFVMELPHYHLPGIRSVLRRAIDRTWLYIKKVGTIVVAVATVVYVLLQFPGLNAEQDAAYRAQAETAITRFYQDMQGNRHLAAVNEQEKLVALINVYNDYRAQKLNISTPEASQKLDARYEEMYPEFFPFLQRGGDAQDKKAARSLKKLDDSRKTLRREMKELRIENSVLGRVGRGLESVTRFANFDWKVNVALLSSFAARESSVATLGVLFGQDDEENRTLEERMGEEQQAQGYDALTAVALILFFALYPPCLATVIMIRVQTGSYKWMLFSMIFPTILGLLVAGAVYTLGSMAGASGLQAFSAVYFAALGLLLAIGLYHRPSRKKTAAAAVFRQPETRRITHTFD